MRLIGTGWVIIRAPPPRPTAAKTTCRDDRSTSANSFNELRLAQIRTVMRVPHPRKLGEPACTADFLLTRVTRIFQKRVLTQIAPAGKSGTPLAAFHCPNATGSCRERLRGQFPLFPDCYLQWLAQLTRVTAREGRGEGPHCRAM